MTFNLNPAAVGVSAATEIAVGTEMAASSVGTSEPLLAPIQMALDGDSLEFNLALQAAGAAYTGVKAEHVVQRAVYAAAQAGASVATEANEAITAAANSLA